MATLTKTVTNWFAADTYIGNRQERNAGNNTTLHRLDNGDIAVRLHRTDVVIYHRDDDTVTLNSGGWQTVTTKERMNRFTNVRVYQEKHVWYVVEYPYDWDSPVEFADGDRYSN